MLIRVVLAVVIISIVEFYFIKRFSRAIKFWFEHVDKKTLNRIFLYALLYLNLYPAIILVMFLYGIITGTGFDLPESRIVDYLIIYPFWFYIILIAQTILYLFLLDIFKLIILPLYRKHRKKRTVRKIDSIIVVTLISLFIIYIPVRIVYDYNTVSVNEIVIEKKNLPAALDGFKIAFISDVQADRYTDRDRLQNFIDKVNNTDPDLVLIAGDIITSTPKYIDTAAAYIGKLNSKYGVYTCVGDHDNWAYRNNYAKSLSEIRSALKRYNIEMLHNKNKIFDIDTASIGVTFVTNTYVETVTTSTLNQLILPDMLNLKIFLTHQPQQRMITHAEKSGYDLYLAGHTHGGQVTFLFPFVYLSPTLFETKYLRGEFEIGKMKLIVTRGLGMSIVPLRYNSTPEVTLIKLKK